MTTLTSLRIRHIDAPANLVLLGALWVGYTAVRTITSHTSSVALSNAARLLEIQSAVGLDIERAAQSAVSSPVVFVAANAYYLVHFPLTLAVMAFAFWRSRRSVFPVLRNSLIGSTAVALFVHVVVPMAPPRMLPGFIDASVTYGPNPYTIPGSQAVNQYAAMPSMHVGWAILAAYAVWSLGSGPITRSAAILHPVLTAVVVVVTGHHFVSDAVVGAFLAFVFLMLAINLRQARFRSEVGDEVDDQLVDAIGIVVQRGDVEAVSESDNGRRATHLFGDVGSRLGRNNMVLLTEDDECGARDRRQVERIDGLDQREQGSERRLVVRDFDHAFFGDVVANGVDGDEPALNSGGKVRSASRVGQAC